MVKIGDYVTTGYTEGTLVDIAGGFYRLVTESGTVVSVSTRCELNQCEGENPLKEGAILRFYGFSLGIFKRIENSKLICETPDGEKAFSIYSLKKVYKLKEKPVKA